MALPLRRPVGIAGALVLLVAVAGAVYATVSHSRSATSSRSRSATSSPMPAGIPGVNFARDGVANAAAGEMAQQLLKDLPGIANYAGTQIVSYGIEVDVAGQPSAAMKAAVARDTQEYRGKPIPVGYRSVRYSERELDSVKAALSTDQGQLAAQGIQLTTWGIDLDSNTVQIGLNHYLPAYRTALLARYGDRVSVIAHDVQVSGD